MSNHANLSPFRIKSRSSYTVWLQAGRQAEVWCFSIHFSHLKRWLSVSLFHVFKLDFFRSWIKFVYELPAEHPLAESRPLRELLGHTPPQVWIVASDKFLVDCLGGFLWCRGGDAVIFKLFSCHKRWLYWFQIPNIMRLVKISLSLVNSFFSRGGKLSGPKSEFYRTSFDYEEDRKKKLVIHGVRRISICHAERTVDFYPR